MRETNPVNVHHSHAAFRVAASDLFEDDDDDDLFEDEETLVYVEIDEDVEVGPDVSWVMVDDDEVYGVESEVTLCDRSIEIDVSELRSPARPPPLPVTLPKLAVSLDEHALRALPSPPRLPSPPLKKRPLPFKARPVSPWSLESYRGRVIAVKARRRKDARPPVPPPWLSTPPVDVPSSTAPVTLPASPEDLEDHPGARIVSHDEPSSAGRSFAFALVCGAIGALLYVGAQRYESPHAHPAASVPARETVMPSSTASAAPSSTPASSAAHAPSASASAGATVHTPPPAAKPHVAAPLPKRPAAPSVPVAQRTARSASPGDGVEKALSDARRETDSTL